MKNVIDPIDSFFLSRWLHLPVLQYLFKLKANAENKSGKQGSANIPFPKPRYELFQKIRQQPYFNFKEYQFFSNLIYTFKSEILMGMLITLCCTCFTLTIPETIKSFMNLMQNSQHGKKEVEQAQKIILIFIILQSVRMILSLHVKRLFSELSIKIQSCLCQKMVRKMLKINIQYRHKVPQTEIYQLQNVDIKLISKLFQNLGLIFQIPFTIGIVLFLLFYQHYTYGLIGVYWFTITFWFQRSLDDKMSICNQAKLNLIEKRSKFNYETLEKIKQARLGLSQTLLLEKNNDFFLQQNEDHKKFYRYQTFYDISQILMPIFVVITIAIYHKNQENPFSVHSLYAMLSLLGICHKPMLNFRTFTIGFNDGMHSLKRLELLFNFPDQQLNSVHYSIKKGEAQILIKKQTYSIIETPQGDVDLKIEHEIILSQGERLIILGRKEQGSTSLINMIIGVLPIYQGKISLTGTIAYHGDDEFFLNQNIFQNLSFFRNKYQSSDVKKMFQRLGLEQEPAFVQGLNEHVEPTKFTENQLKIIGLGRVFCSDANIYVLDNPFIGFSSESIAIIEQILREKQEQGKIIIIAQKFVRNINQTDKILIVNDACTIQYGLFSELIENKNSKIHHFTRHQNIIKSKTQIAPLCYEFQRKIKKIMIYELLYNNVSTKQKMDSQKLKKLLGYVTKYSFKLKKHVEQQNEHKSKEKKEKNHIYLIYKFLLAAPVSETIFAFFAITGAQILHIFIHFYIGHEYKEHPHAKLSEMKSLMIYQIALTFGLAGIIYLQNQITSHISVIKGNQLYKLSLQALSQKNLKWYSKIHFPILANKFNHDYEEVFQAQHYYLSIYKNIVILIFTLLAINGSKRTIISLVLIICIFYLLVVKLFRYTEDILIQNHSKYKYEFAKVFHETVEGATVINLYQKQKQMQKRAEDHFLDLAAYRQGVYFVNQAQHLITNLLSTTIMIMGLNYGTILLIKKGEQSEAIIATSIMLITNLSDVINSISIAIVKFEAFFRLNIATFLTVIDSNQTKIERITKHQSLRSMKSGQVGFGEQSTSEKSSILGFDVLFNNVILKDSDDPLFEIYSLYLRIPESQWILMYVENQFERNNILYGLTRNLQKFREHTAKKQTILIGGVRINNILIQDLRSVMGVILHETFYFSGTIKQNLSWRNPNFNQQQALKFSNELLLSQQIKDYRQHGLDAKIEFNHDTVNAKISKKLALLRLLLRKPKIVIIKDTNYFVGTFSIFELLQKYLPDSTFISISSSLQGGNRMDRIVCLKKMKIIEDGQPSRLIDDKFSIIGERLRSFNYQQYEFLNRAQLSAKGAKIKKSIKLNRLLKKVLFNKRKDTV